MVHYRLKALRVLCNLRELLQSLFPFSDWNLDGVAIWIAIPNAVRGANSAEELDHLILELRDRGRYRRACRGSIVTTPDKPTGHEQQQSRYRKDFLHALIVTVPNCVHSAKSKHRLR